MLSENKWEQYGFPRSEFDIRGITLKETDRMISAEDCSDQLENGTSNYAYHYICDKDQIIQLMPLDYGVNHVGVGRSVANEQNIAIGLCSTLSDSDFDRSLAMVIELIKELKNQFNLGYDQIYFYQDFMRNKYNPKSLIMRYKSSKRFAYETLLEEE